MHFSKIRFLRVSAEIFSDSESTSAGRSHFTRSPPPCCMSLGRTWEFRPVHLQLHQALPVALQLHQALPRHAPKARRLPSFPSHVFLPSHVCLLFLGCSFSMVDGQVMNKVQMVMTMQMLAQALPGYMRVVAWFSFFYLSDCIIYMYLGCWPRLCQATCQLLFGELFSSFPCQCLCPRCFPIVRRLRSIAAVVLKKVCVCVCVR